MHHHDPMSDLADFDFTLHDDPGRADPHTPPPPQPTAGHDRPEIEASRSDTPRMLILIAVAGLAVAVIAGGLALLTSRTTTTDPTTAGDAVTTSTDREVEAVAWRGATLPASDADGPRDLTDTHAAGFARTPLGAALAAVHLSVRIDPHAGPDTFEPTIRQQVSGNTQQLLASVQRTYIALAQQAGVTDGAPIIAATGAITGWRIDDDTSGSRPVVVDLRVDVPGGTAVNFAVTVTWDPRTNDWTLESPHGAEAFAMTDAHGDYTNFFPTGS